MSRRLAGAALASILFATAVPAVLAGAAGPVYEVQPGDTLSQIAESHGVPLATLQEWNGLETPDLIYSGQTIRVAPPETASEAPQEPQHTEYVVQEGDSLAAIANRFGVTVSAIAEANNLDDANRIFVGETLHIPRPAAPAEDQSPAPRARFYRVEPGDTLTSIAAHFKVTVAAIAEANGIANASLIVEGRVLMIPGVSVPGGLPPPVSKTDARNALIAAADEFGVPVALFLGLTWQESGWQHDVVSDAGAVGLTQILPETAEWTATVVMGEELDWFRDYAANARVGAAHLRYLLGLSGGDEEMAVAAYYQGWDTLMELGMFAETAQYVANVMLFKEQFAT